MNDQIIKMILGVLELGGIFAVLSLGLFISFKILNIPDLTVDGSFTTGCATSAVITLLGSPVLGLALAFVTGCLAGIVTGLFITKLKINPILSGILTQTGLYSVNLRIMNQSSNIALLDNKTIFTSFAKFEPYDKIVIIGLIVILLVLLLNYFLKTQMGLALRACGDNEDMVRASSIDTDKMKVIGLGLANGLVGLSGAIYTQQQAYADMSAGIGMMVIGLASIIIGTTLIRSDRVSMLLIATVIGSIVYRAILTIALQFNITTGDLKILSAGIVIVAISSTSLKRRKKKHVKN